MARYMINRNTDIKFCTVCFVPLDDENWTPNGTTYKCKECYRLYMKNYIRQYVRNNKGNNLQRRLRPDNCEVCNFEAKTKKLYYHHWDDKTPHLGVWVCYLCHNFVERFEKRLLSKYIKLKTKIIRENNYDFK